MKRISIIKAVAAVAALGLGGSSWAAMNTQDTQNTNNMGEQPQAQEPSSSAEAQQPGQPGNLTSAERNFLQTAAETNATEIELGRLAEQKATDPNIKKIGQDLVRDHTAANQKLERLASSKGVTVTAQPTSAQQRMITSLSETSGNRFNKQFLRQARISHERSLALFERTSRRAQDPQIRSFASQMVPSLQEHLAMTKGHHPAPVAEKNQMQPKKSTEQPQ